MPSKKPTRKDKNRVPRDKRAIAPVHKDAERVAKVIARAGLGSRREIEDWIEAGRVAVNGTVLQSPAVTVTAHDRIEVDGAPLPEKERTRLFLYHKPRGVVTTNRDPEGRATLFEILPKGLPRLVSVGRLDLNSEGLLLLTNDGGLARVLELPETGWLRRYRVRAKGEIDQAKLDRLLQGITVDGVTYGPIEATLDRVQGANAWLTMGLREGKNREVRNVLAGLGMAVNRLIRVSYGPFQLGDLPEGGIEEVRTRVLRDQIGAELVAASGADFDAPVREIEEIEEPAPPRRQPAAADAAPARSGARHPRRLEREPEARGRSRHPESTREDAVSYRVKSRKAEPERERELESRGTVADRKGREIKVERVVREDSAPPERPARRGPPRQREDGVEPRGRGAPRGAGERGERRSRPDTGHEERGGPRRDGRAARPQDSREDFRRGGEGTQRGRRSGTVEERPRARPARPDRAEGERRGGGWEERPPRPRREERPEGRKPAGGRFAGERSFESRSADDRPARPRAHGDRPKGPHQGDERAYGDRPSRPARPRPEGRPPRERREQGGEDVGFLRGDAPRGRGPSKAGFSKAGFSKDAPARGRSEGSREERGSGERRVSKGPGKPGGFGGKPSGGRPFGAKPGGGRPGGGKPGGSKPGAGKPGGRPGPRRGG